MFTWKSWAPQKLRLFEDSLETAFGVWVGKERRASKFEYERDVRGMTEEEELDYVTKKIGEEMKWDDVDDE